ncbi:Leucine-rich repeat-containing protein 57 [Frankliniella fusca]|uniref:Leucine-rich repeat-containing protein 57 n=1 Tax=Frankliniella fusca TaxID=407009 RepID=A0AAE1HY65_9NEOP|nr:Leucine-rich repeat-containing protein 57 [Frankliniella fusca]
MGNTALQQKCETASKTGVLKISQRKLTEFPNSVKRLDQVIRVLDFSENHFALIPKEIGSFLHLKQLNLEKNRLISLPEEIGNLTKLESFNVSNNKLTTLPVTLEKLNHLKQVQITDNLLTVFPLMLCGLKHLDFLDVSRNKISEVPDGVENLYVTELVLNQNQVRSISDSIAKCPRLKTLRLEENCLQLSAVPLAILTESSISTIALEGNLFEMKEFMNLEGYDAYMERYTAVKKKMF